MALFRRIEPPEGTTTIGSLPVVAVDRFEHVDPATPGDADPFSRAVVEFKAGEDAHRGRFREAFGRLLAGPLGDAVTPGVATVLPGHAAGSLHGPLVELASAAVAGVATGPGSALVYDQRLRRTRTVTRQRDRPREDRWGAIAGIRDSLGVRGGLDGRAVLLVDDVVVTGASLAAGADLLAGGGAGRVVGLALGMTADPDNRRIDPAGLEAVLP